MKNFVYEIPTKIIFGKGQIAKIGGEASRFGRRVLLVYGMGSIKKNGVYDQVMASLGDSGLDVVEFSGVRSNPVLSHARKGIESARREKIEVVLAVGGGSVIDEAKTIAAGVFADHDPWDFFTYKKVIEAALPILTVVTMSASASEMNGSAVMTNDETAQKFSTRSIHLYPKTSILDPTVLYTVGADYTAYSAVDAITHMLEGYFNGAELFNPLQDGLVENLTRVLMDNTAVNLKNPMEYDARANSMWATTLAFNGLTTAGIGRAPLPVHMIEHSLSAIYDIAHGAGLSIVLPGWMKFALPEKYPKIAHFGRRIFNIEEEDDMEAARRGIEALKAWFVSIGSPVSLAEGNIPEEDIGKIAANAATLADVWGLTDYKSPVIESILEQCR